MTYRVVQWSTGNVGTHALAGIIANPHLELVGVWVSSDAKAGVDAGVLAGLDHEVGVVATTDADALIACKPDCVVYTAMTDNRLVEALADLRRFLEAGINVAASAPVFLQFPYGVIPAELIEPLEQAAALGNSSIWVNGIDPGFANDLLPLALTGACARIESVRCTEIVDYATYDNRAVMVDIMGFGKPMDETPLLLQQGVLALAWGSVVRQIAAALGVELDRVDERHERLPASVDTEIAAGRIAAGDAAALRFEVRGMVGSHPVVVLEHVTRTAADQAPDWPQPSQAGGSYRVEITGEPSYRLDLTLTSAGGDHNHAHLVATAMRVVNAVPAVVDAPAGIRTTAELPLVTGNGMVGFKPE